MRDDGWNMISSDDDDRSLFDTIEMLRQRPWDPASGQWTQVRHRGRIYVLELHYSRPDPKAGTPATSKGGGTK